MYYTISHLHERILELFRGLGILKEYFVVFDTIGVLRLIHSREADFFVLGPFGSGLRSRVDSDAHSLPTMAHVKLNHHIVVTNVRIEQCLPWKLN